MADDMLTGLELRTLATEEGELRLSLEEVTVDAPDADEIVVKVEASPINPSDLGLLLGPADLSTAQAGGSGDRPTLTYQLPPQRMRMMQARLGQSLPVGNEGAGTVVQAGANQQANAEQKCSRQNGERQQEASRPQFCFHCATG